MATLAAARDFGRYLQKHRMTGNISLAQISQQTRITISCLQMIENEDIRQLPAPVFVKGFLRAYAEVVGADAEEAVNRYNASINTLLQNEQVQFQLSGKSNFWRHFSYALLIMGIVISLTLYLASRVNEPEPQITQKETIEQESETAALVPETAPTLQEKAPETAALVPETVAPIQEEVPETTIETKAPDTDLHLELVAVQPTWLKIIADSNVPKEFTLQPSDQMELTAKTNFSLLIGNARGVHITLNGKPVPVPGKSGQVVTLQLP